MSEFLQVTARLTAVDIPHHPLRRWASLALLGLAVASAWGQETAVFEQLAVFERPGRQPLSSLVLHANGLLYGTTVAGGAWDRGTVYQLTPAGVRSTLHAFTPDAGSAPLADLVSDATGTLYGTTTEGGDFGFGTIFKITTDGDFTTLVHFTGTGGAAPGSVPGGLVRHADGAFYGTTGGGGTFGWGTVYRLAADGTLTSLTAFTGNEGILPGSEPQGAMVVIGDNLFGVTRSGGSGGMGTLFRISTGGQAAVLREFSGADGRAPASGLTLHPDGWLYGTTEFGGDGGVGTAYRFDPDTPSQFTVLHHFADLTGSQPVGSLLVEATGSILGVASSGGVDGWGSLFRLEVSGSHELLFSFSGLGGTTPGASPRSGLVAGPGGDFYGATSAGGPSQRGVVFRIDAFAQYEKVADFSPQSGWAPSGAPVPVEKGGLLFPMARGGSSGLGLLAAVTGDGMVITIEELTFASGGRLADSLVPSGTGWLGVAGEGGSLDRGTVVHYDPSAPPVALANVTSGIGEGVRGPLTEGEPGNFYGVVERSGLIGEGGVFRVDLDGGLERLFRFTGTAGAYPGSRPQAPLAKGADGSLYGVTESGGAEDQGVVYRIAPDGNFSVIAEFGATGPRRPRGGLTATVDGRLFGTTSLGGPTDAGTVFELNPADGSRVTVAEFTGGGGALPGATPVGPLTPGVSGRLFGMTADGLGGWGTAFAVNPSGGVESLVVFTGIGGAAPGITTVRPEAQVEWVGGLNEMADGTIHGVTPAGGPGGGGTVFRLRSSLTFESWKLTFLGDEAAPDLGDPDRDGLSNLLEYALQLSPTVPDPSPVEPEMQHEAGQVRLGLALTRDPARADVTMVIESASSPFGPWVLTTESRSGGPFAGTGLVQEVANGSGLWDVLVTDQVPTTELSPRFMRLRVIR